jgi:hypothetical protein
MLISFVLYSCFIIMVILSALEPWWHNISNHQALRHQGSPGDILYDCLQNLYSVIPVSDFPQFNKII